MHIREKSRGLTCYFLFFLLPLPFSFAFPLIFFSFHTLCSCLPWARNYLKIYTPDSLLSCIIRLIPKFLSFFCIGSLVHFFISFPLIFFSFFISKFLLLFSYFSSLSPFPSPSLLPSLPFFFTLLWFSSLALRAFDSFPPLGGGNYRRIYTPAINKFNM